MQKEADTDRLNLWQFPYVLYSFNRASGGRRHTQCMPSVIDRNSRFAYSNLQWGAVSTRAVHIWALTAKAGTVCLQTFKPSTDLIPIHHPKHRFIWKTLMHLILLTNDDFDRICFFSNKKAGCQFNSSTTVGMYPWLARHCFKDKRCTLMSPYLPRTLIGA